MALEDCLRGSSSLLELRDYIRDDSSLPHELVSGDVSANDGDDDSHSVYIHDARSNAEVGESALELAFRRALRAPNLSRQNRAEMQRLRGQLDIVSNFVRTQRDDKATVDEMRVYLRAYMGGRQPTDLDIAAFTRDLRCLNEIYSLGPLVGDPHRPAPVGRNWGLYGIIFGLGVVAAVAAPRGFNRIFPRRSGSRPGASNPRPDEAVVQRLRDLEARWGRVNGQVLGLGQLAPEVQSQLRPQINELLVARGAAQPVIAALERLNTVARSNSHVRQVLASLGQRLDEATLRPLIANARQVASREGDTPNGRMATNLADDLEIILAGRNAMSRYVALEAGLMPRLEELIRQRTADVVRGASEMDAVLGGTAPVIPAAGQRNVGGAMAPAPVQAPLIAPTPPPPPPPPPVPTPAPAPQQAPAPQPPAGPPQFSPEQLAALQSLLATQTPPAPAPVAPVSPSPAVSSAPPPPPVTTPTVTPPPPPPPPPPSQPDPARPRGRVI